VLKRLIYAAVGVLGLTLIGLGIASATAWRADDVLVADGTASGAILVTDPGVLELAGNPVTIRATVPQGGDVVLAIGRDTDVAGWVGDDAHQRVTGLTGWHTLAFAAPGATVGPTPTGGATPTGTATSTPTPTPAPTPTSTSGSTADPGSTGRTVPNPAGSDMWLAQAQGTGSATLTWAAREGRWSLLVVGTDGDGGAVSPTLSLAWPRVVTTPWLLPGVLVGSLLVLACLALFGSDWLRTRRRPELAEWTPVLTGALPTVGADGTPATIPTRRQLREAQARAAGRPPTGSIPAVPTTTAQTAVIPVPTAPTAFVPVSDDASPAVPGPVAGIGARAGGHAGGTAGADSAPPSTPADAPPGSRRARRAAGTADPSTSGTAEPSTSRSAGGLSPADGSRDPATGGRPAAGDAGPHEGRPIWARAGHGAPATASGPAAAPPTPTAAPPTPAAAPLTPAAAPPASPAAAPPAQPSAARVPVSWVPVSPVPRAAAHPTSSQPPIVHPSWLPAGERPAPAQVPAAAPASSGPDGGPASASADRRPRAEAVDTARADAWRRAWGLPATEHDPTPAATDPDQEPRADDGREEHR